MTTTWAKPFAIGGLLLAIAGGVGAAVVRYVRPAPITGGFGFGETTMVGYVLAGLTWAAIGGVLVNRRPGNAVGWLMVLVGVGYALSQLTVAMTFAFAAEGTAQGEKLAEVAGWVTVLLQLATILQIAIGFIFPSGRAQSREWAVFMHAFWVFAGVFSVISLTQPGPLQLLPSVHNPLGFGPDLRGDLLIAPILSLLAAVTIGSLVVSMVTRYRAAGRLERQQMKWFILALSLSATALGIVSLQSSVVNRPDSELPLTVYVFSGAIVPIAIGIAILRYRLYAIDRIISRTISYAILSVIVGAVFLVALFTGQLLLAGILGTNSPLITAASTLAAFALFQPLRRRVQTAVDQRFDRARYDAQRTVDAFAGEARNDVDIDSLRLALLTTADGAVRPRSATVWLRNVPNRREATVS